MRARNAGGVRIRGAAVDVVETMLFELEVTGAPSVGDVRNRPHVRIRNADFLHAALNDDWCFEVVLGGGMMRLNGADRQPLQAIAVACAKARTLSMLLIYNENMAG
jgi:hypothetical protein